MTRPCTVGIGSYSSAPLLAWSGWRLRPPGGPVGGQYHGYIASDDIVDGLGWPAGHDETFRPMDNPAGLGTYPWQAWDPQWAGIPLEQGETVSDYVYRSSAETRPRANASGGVNTVRAVQQERTAGYAVAPGNYRGIGYAITPVADGHFYGGPGGGRYYPGVYHPICPAWGCGPPPHTLTPDGVKSPAPAPVVMQPVPPVTPAPAPTVAGGCPTGQYQDAAGNCTSDWHNPYSLYLPQSPAPAPTVAAVTCPTGYTQDPNTGNCLAPGVAASTPSTGIGAWLTASSSIAGMNIPNYLLAGIGALAAFKMLSPGGGRR